MSHNFNSLQASIALMALSGWLHDQSSESPILVRQIQDDLIDMSIPKGWCLENDQTYNPPRWILRLKDEPIMVEVVDNEEPSRNQVKLRRSIRLKNRQVVS